MPDTTAPQTASAETAPAPSGHRPPSTGPAHNLTIAALGVVFGDIGTSPLYAIKQCFHDGSAVTEPRVFGVLSLIIWALTIVVTGKYVILLMRADNRGEGGIFALTIQAWVATEGRRNRWILIAGLIGGSLFFGDSVLTPAISVLSAVEGLEVRAPELQPYVIPLTLVLLIVLFMAQRRGTGRVGGFFGPVLILWFSVLGFLGLMQIAQNPGILKALNPLYGIELIVSDPVEGFVLLGAVVLGVTGAEALYADMGHFGRAPIRRAWFYFVFPCLLLNYFGQGALLLTNPETLQNPFYYLAPDWAVFPLVALASAATVIASQAVISGAFSLSRQPVQLGYLPRMQVRHTSEQAIGQVFLPEATSILLVAVQRARDAMPLDLFIETLRPERPVRVPGPAIFMTRDLTQVPVALLHALKHYKALHERVVILQVDTAGVPHVPDERRLEIQEIGKGFYTMLVHYGFMDEPNIMRALALCRMQHFHVNLMETSFFIGREKIRPRPRRTGFLRWRDRLFIFLTNVAVDATQFFRIPPNPGAELGGQGQS